MPSFTAYMVSEDKPFEFDPSYGAYMPCVTDPRGEDFWAWLPRLMEKIRHDLIALGRWDRQCIDVRVWIGALTGRAARAHLRARVGVSGRQLCCSMLGCTARSVHEACAAAHV